MLKETVPSDSRYIPFVQQPYCCGPACIQTILYKNNLPLLAQEEIGAYLGLVVPEGAKDAFYNAEVRSKPAVDSGFGTRIQEPQFSMDSLLKKQGWSFVFEPLLASTFKTVDQLSQKLAELINSDTDALICFQNDHGTGHICVLDKLLKGDVRIIDPSPDAPKWRIMSQQELFDRIQAHGDDNYGGVWVFNKS